MAYYHVELGYHTKRGGVAVGATVNAFGPDEADEIMRKKFLDPYPARKFAFCNIREADETEISFGAVNEPAEPA